MYEFEENFSSHPHQFLFSSRSKQEENSFKPIHISSWRLQVQLFLLLSILAKANKGAERKRRKNFKRFVFTSQWVLRACVRIKFYKWHFSVCACVCVWGNELELNGLKKSYALTYYRNLFRILTHIHWFLS